MDDTSNFQLKFYSPLRLSLAGGGTDLPEVYFNSGAHLLSVTINKQISIKIGKKVKHQSSLLTDLFRSKHPKLGVSIKSEVSPGAGLGGSGALAVNLAAADFYLRKKNLPSALKTALTAYHWERELLKQPVGFQDQVSAAFGGCVEMKAETNGKITVKSRDDLIDGLSYLFLNNFIFVETGIRRNASKLLNKLSKTYSKPNCNTKDNQPATVTDMERVIRSKDGKLFGSILQAHWKSKCSRLPGATTPEIDSIINIAFKAGATGAKAIGAGGGGFILISSPSEHKKNIVETLQQQDINTTDFLVSTDGVKRKE